MPILEREKLARKTVDEIIENLYSAKVKSHLRKEFGQRGFLQETPENIINEMINKIKESNWSENDKVCKVKELLEIIDVKSAIKYCEENGRYYSAARIAGDYGRELLKLLIEGKTREAAAAFGKSAEYFLKKGEYHDALEMFVEKAKITRNKRDITKAIEIAKKLDEPHKVDFGFGVLYSPEETAKVFCDLYKLAEEQGLAKEIKSETQTYCAEGAFSLLKKILSMEYTDNTLREAEEFKKIASLLDKRDEILERFHSDVSGSVSKIYDSIMKGEEKEIDPYIFRTVYFASQITGTEEDRNKAIYVGERLKEQLEQWADITALETHLMLAKLKGEPEELRRYLEGISIENLTTYSDELSRIAGGCWELGLREEAKKIWRVYKEKTECKRFIDRVDQNVEVSAAWREYALTRDERVPTWILSFTILSKIY